MNKQLITFFVSCSILFTPVTAFASLKLSSTDVATQIVLEDVGYSDTITEQTLKGFQSDKEFDINKIAHEQILENSNIDNTDYIKTGALDWFSSVQYIFTRGQEATVTDIATGKSFKLKRTFGTNHADVEPLTKEDAKIIKDIWGSWSWERRAVVVNSEGNIIAGSMTAFPHAGLDNLPAVKVVANRSGNYRTGQNLDAVKGNGVDGHMDIHFLNSRTHGSNVVQKTHQDMVQKAAEYIDKNY